MNLIQDQGNITTRPLKAQKIVFLSEVEMDFPKFSNQLITQGLATVT